MRKAIFGSMSNKTIKLLAIVIGLLVGILGYRLGYTNFMEKKAVVDSENTKLQTEISTLTKIAKLVQENKDKIPFYEAKTYDVVSAIPPLRNTEDVIAAAMKLEKDNPTSLEISSINIGGNEIRYGTGSQASVAKAQNSPVSAYKEDGTPIDDIFVLTQEDMQGMSLVTVTPDYSYELYATPVTYAFSVGYDEMKTTLDAIKEAYDVQSIISVILSTEQESGNLVGTVLTNQYTILGTDVSYTSPKLTEVPIGNEKPFSTID